MRRDFVGERQISNRVPITPLLGWVSAPSYSSTVKRFIEDTLSGAATVEVGRVDNGNIEICTYFTAYIIRLAVEYLAYDNPIHVSISGYDGRFSLSIEYNCDAPVEVIRNIETAAKSAGWQITASPSKIELLTKHRFSVELPLYSHTITPYYIDMFDIFFR